jgi:hypothetical protein
MAVPLNVNSASSRRFWDARDDCEEKDMDGAQNQTIQKRKIKIKIKTKTKMKRGNGSD